MPKSKHARRSKSKSGYVGVRKKLSGKYEATVWINGKIKNLGSSYDTAKKAAKAHDKEAIKFRKPFSTLNYPKTAPVGYTPIQQALHSHNTLGYRGVYKNGKNFMAAIRIGGIQRHLGTYDTTKDAAIAHDRAILKANKSISLLNFPDMVHNLDVEPERKKYKRSSTGYKGVDKQKSGMFRARINISSGKRKSLGKFDTAIQAALAYDQAAIKKGYTKFRLNFPKDQKKQKKQEKQAKEKKQKKQKKTKKKDVLTMQEYKEMLEIWNDME
jgi:hypothetical protein